MYLLHGENSYNSWQELLKLKTEIKKKEVDFEFLIYDSDEIDLTTIDISGYSMFVKRYFYIFKRFFSLPKDVRESIWNEVLKLKLQDVIFWEPGSADKRSKVYKEILKKGIVREFSSLKEREMYTWIGKELDKRNIKHDNEFVHEIYFRFGNNQFIIENELNKLKIYLQTRNKNSVDKQAYEIISYGMVQDNWKFIELFFTKKKKEAIDYLNNSHLEIDEQKMIIGGIASTLRNVLLSKNYQGEKLKYAASKLSIHPFVLTKSSNYARNFTFERLVKLYEQLMNFDYSLNLGKIEFKLGMVLLIMSL